MKISHIIACSMVALGSFAFVACENGSSADENVYDCSVKKDFVVVAPEGGETFKVGEKIKVIFGTNVETSSFRVIYRANYDLDGNEVGDEDLTGSDSIPYNQVVNDGKTCNTVELVLDPELVVPSDSAVIAVSEYSGPKRGYSKPFKVKQ